MKTSLVVPCHNEEANVAPLYDALVERMPGISDFEIVYVDDGSTDGTLARIKQLREKDPRVKYLRFMKNYGHQKALMAGLRHCRYDCAVSMDADLQHPVETIPEFFEMQRSTGADVVMGKRRTKQKGLIKNLTSRLFYSVFALATGVPIVPGASDFRLYTRKALDVLCPIREREPFLRGMIPHLGLRTAVVEYDSKPRVKGEPSYTFGRSTRMALYALLRYSRLPARLGVILGTGGIVLGLAQGVHYAYLRLFTSVLVPGQADLMVFLSLICSVILVMMSLQLKLLSQIHDHLRGEPDYVVEESCLDS